MRVMKVEGIGELKVLPNQVHISFTIIYEDKDYKVVTSTINQKQSKLLTILNEIGIKSEEIKTVNYNVHNNYKNVLVANEQKREHIGYKAILTMLLKVPFDNELLEKVLKGASRDEINAEIDIKFTTSDRENKKAELLSKAVENAKQKAKVLAHASSVVLGDIVEVNYGAKAYNFYSNTNIAPRALMASADGIGQFTPEEITLSESVNIVWEIK